MKNRPSRAVLVTLLTAFVLVCEVRASAQSQTLRPIPQRIPVDVFVSVGDIHWDYRFQPLDSVSTIEAYIERLAVAQKARRIYWRGEQDADVLRNGVFRVDNPQEYEHWTSWQHSLNISQDFNKLAVRAAHKRHIKMIMVQSLYDFGGPADSDPATMPFTYEDKFRIDHPEYIPVDRSGRRRQPGPLEFAYPAVRKHLVERWLTEITKGGYDGLQLYTYFENYGTSYEDEFGYNLPIVSEYKRRYGVDIRYREFDREKWKSLRGEYVTIFFAELHAALKKKGKFLSINLSAHAPEKVQDWPLNTGRYLIPTKMDWKTWVQKDLVDEIAIAGGSEPEQIAFANQIFDLSPGQKTLPSIFTERPTFNGFDELVKRGMGITGWSAPLPTQPMERYSFDTLTPTDVQSSDWKQRCQALAQAAAGNLTLDPRKVMDCLRDSHPLVRRQAINTCRTLKLLSAVTSIAELLKDDEQCVSSAAALALGDLGDKSSVKAILSALESNPSWIFKESASTGLASLAKADYTTIVAALKDDKWFVRQVAARALRSMTNPEIVEALENAGRSDKANTVRFYALSSMRAHPTQRFINFLMDSLHDRSPLVSSYAAKYLGELTTLMRPEQKSRAFDELSVLFNQYDANCKRSDKDWGWRLVGSALKQLGPNGVSYLDNLRASSGDTKLAWRAFVVLYLPLGQGTFPTYTEADVTKAFQNYAPKTKSKI